MRIRSDDSKATNFNRRNRKIGMAAMSHTAQVRKDTKQKLEEQDERRKELDEKYKTIVSVICNELRKREIDLSECNTLEFNSKIDEIIETVISTNIFRKFKDDSIVDIRNAVKRCINNARDIQLKPEEGPEI